MNFSEKVLRITAQFEFSEKDTYADLAMSKCLEYMIEQRLSEYTSKNFSEWKQEFDRDLVELERKNDK